LKFVLMSHIKEALNRTLKTNTKTWKSTIFWNIMPCSPLSVNRRFGRKYRLHLQGRKNKFNKKPACKQVLNVFFRPWIWRRYFPLKRRLTPNGLHCVISQKMVLFITTGVETSNPKYQDFVIMLLKNQLNRLVGKGTCLCSEGWTCCLFRPSHSIIHCGLQNKPLSHRHSY
jgi:hypothetical protein